jgi:hypothetical protein
VRSSNPRGPGEMRANAIRCLHTGHIGRSLVEAVIPQIPAADHTPSAAGVFNIRARRTFRGAPKGTSPVGPGWASRFARKRGLRGPAPSPQKAGLRSCERCIRRASAMSSGTAILQAT